MRRCAFTLIELLVVVAIIAVLIAILIPSLSRAREQGKAVKCQSNMRMLAVAVTLYAQQNRDWLPQWGFNHGGGDTNKSRAWLKTMGKEYGENAGLLRCPVDRSPTWIKPYNGNLRVTSYATNYFLSAENKNDTEIGFRSGHPFNSTRWVERPAATVFVAELAEEGDYAVSDHVHPENWAYFFPAERAEAAGQVALERHLKQANYAYLDGHAERLPFEKTFQIGKPNDDYLLIEWFYNKWDPTVAK